MLKRVEFVSLFGFEGKNAIIDKHFAAAYAKKGTIELAELGYYKAAICSAIYSNSDHECARLLEWLHAHGLFADYDFEELTSIFGVHENMQVEKVIRV